MTPSHGLCLSHHIALIDLDVFHLKTCLCGDRRSRRIQQQDSIMSIVARFQAEPGIVAGWQASTQKLGESVEMTAHVCTLSDLHLLAYVERRGKYFDRIVNKHAGSDLHDRSAYV